MSESPEVALGDARQIVLSGLLRIRSERSLWFIEPERYLRLPQAEDPRVATFSVDDALRDGEWMPHRGAFVYRDRFGMRVRLVPSWRSDDAVGIITGVIVEATPAVDTWVTSAEVDL